MTSSNNFKTTDNLPTVNLVRCGSYSAPQLQKAMEKTFEPFKGLNSIIRPGDKVLIKLNLLMPAKPEQGVTTHPQMAETLASMIMDCGGKPIFTDSGAVRNWKKLINTTGIAEMAGRIDVPLINIDNKPVIKVNSERFPGIEVSSILNEADHLFGLTKLKTHTQMHFTGAVKHYFGLVPGEKKQEWHFRAGTDHMAFARLLVDICKIVNPTFTIMDGIVAMEGDGPGPGGIPRPLGVILAGKDCAAIDTVAIEIIGANPELCYTQKAHQELYTHPSHIKDIHLINPEVIESVKQTDWKFPEIAPMMIGPKPLRPIIRKHFTLYPHIDTGRCSLCLSCRKVCPSNCIDLVDRSIHVDKNACIRCFCCVEVCPEGAIRSRTPMPRKIIESVTGNRMLKPSPPRVSYKKGAPGLVESIQYAYHITRANIQKSYRRPLSAYLFLTYRCTLNCKYCNVRNNGEQPAEMSTSEILNLLDQMAKAGVKKIQFTGGEPLIRKDIGDIILRAKDNGMFVGISSNGDLVPEKIDMLKPVDVVFISLDGDEATHDPYRGKGSFQKALNACHCLKKHGIDIWTTSVIHKNNIDALDYPLKLAEKNGWIANYQLIHSRETQPDSCEMAEDAVAIPLLEAHENSYAIDFLIEEKKRGAPIGHSFKFLTALKKWGEYRQLVKSEPTAKCWAGKLYVYIEPDGRMFPCGTQIHNKDTVNVLAPGGFSQAWKTLNCNYNCSQCLSGCQMEQNLMFSLNIDVLVNWYNILKHRRIGL